LKHHGDGATDCNGQRKLSFRILRFENAENVVAIEFDFHCDDAGDEFAVNRNYSRPKIPLAGVDFDNLAGFDFLQLFESRAVAKLRVRPFDLCGVDENCGVHACPLTMAVRWRFK
jgi:hypothetical protein